MHLSLFSLSAKRHITYKHFVYVFLTLKVNSSWLHLSLKVDLQDFTQTTLMVCHSFVSFQTHTHTIYYDTFGFFNCLLFV